MGHTTFGQRNRLPYCDGKQESQTFVKGISGWIRTGRVFKKRCTTRKISPCIICRRFLRNLCLYIWQQTTMHRQVYIIPQRGISCAKGVYHAAESGISLQKGKPQLALLLCLLFLFLRRHQNRPLVPRPKLCSKGNRIKLVKIEF